jgi:soluble lytic murein transglycosylase-like protein
MIPDKYDQEIQAATARYWPPEIDWRWWKAQLYQESRLDSSAVSPVGARGLAQFMPGTWNDVCRQLGLTGVSPHEPGPAILAGAYYMGKLAAQWSSPRPEIDKWDLARASYNAGLGNILKAQKVAGGALLYSEIILALPEVTGENSRETITYVERIHKYYEEMAV